MQKLLEKLFNKKNVVFFVVFGVTIVFAALNNSAAAVFLTPVNKFFIRVFGTLSSLTPVSLLSVLTVSVIPLTVLIIWLFVLAKKKLRFIVSSICVACVCLTLFYCVMGFNYSKESVYDTMDLAVEQNDSELLEEAGRYCLEEINDIVLNIEFFEGHSVMNVSFDEMSQDILDTYRSLDSLDFLYEFDLRPKMYFPTFVMNYSNTSGIFFPIFAEINVCANLPDRHLPTTTAHEIAHSKGIMNEGECNFIAEIVCANSDNDFIRYSGLSSIFARLLNRIREVDTDLYDEILSELNPLILSDYAYANDFYRGFDGIIDKISTKLNDLYLKGNDVQGGVNSYSQAVDGILAYFRKYIAVIDNY